MICYFPLSSSMETHYPGKRILDGTSHSNSILALKHSIQDFLGVNPGPFMELFCDIGLVSVTQPLTWRGFAGACFLHFPWSHSTFMFLFDWCLVNCWKFGITLNRRTLGGWSWFSYRILLTRTLPKRKGVWVSVPSRSSLLCRGETSWMHGLLQHEHWSILPRLICPFTREILMDCIHLEVSIRNNSKVNESVLQNTIKRRHFCEFIL